MARTPATPSPPRATPSPPRARTATRAPAGDPHDPAVIAFLRALDHPLKPVVAAVRDLILGVDPAIREEIKWNAPSFRTTESFATFNLRTRDRVRLILHTGAKVKGSPAKMAVADPGGLLERLADDRCLVTLVDLRDVETKRAALQGLVRAWIAALPG